MKKKSRRLLALTLGAALLALTGVLLPAANHREAPYTALDRLADITDFFAFVSYDSPDKVTFIVNVDPLLEPSNGPNYFPFDPEILYDIKIDNNHDGIEDIVFEFRFRDEIRLPGVFTALIGAGAGIVTPANSPPPIPPGTPLIPPAITALDGAGSQGLNLRQNYTVTMVRGGTRTNLARASGQLFAVPSNAGPRTMPDYAGLRAQGIYPISGGTATGVRVFAGTVEDPFWIDLGATFDTLNLRTSAFSTGIAGVMGDPQDLRDDINFAADDVAGFNVNAIAIEVPIALITSTGAIPPGTSPASTIGAWGTTRRTRTRGMAVPPGLPTPDPGCPPGTPPTPSPGPGFVPDEDCIGWVPANHPRARRPQQPGDPTTGLIQIQRMANPLINELLIGTGDKNHFSFSQPSNDGQFAPYLLDPLLARALNAATAGALSIPTPPRTDLLPLVQYMAPIAPGGTPAGPVADLLRLRVTIPPTPAAMRRRMGFIGGDSAGFPNGRRVSDDVTDIALRVVAGVLNPAFNIFPNNRLGDAVNVNDAAYPETFPYLGLAHSGRNSRHQDPNTTGCFHPVTFVAITCPVN